MVGLIILGIIAAIIILIMIVPVGADVSYENGEFKLSAKVCGVLIQLIPKEQDGTEKPKKPKKEKKKKEKPAAENAEKPAKKRSLNFNRDELLDLVRAALRGLGKFGKLRVDRFKLHFIAGGDDPYNTAVTYNYVNAALSSLAPLCSRKFIVKDSDVRTNVDFTADKMSVDFALCLVIRIGQVVRVGLAVAFGALKILIRNKRRLKREKAEAAKTAEAPAEGIESAENGESINIETENNKDNTQENERNDNNG